MIKRFLALVLVCILAIPIFVVPASAATFYTGEHDYSIYQYVVRICDVMLSNLLDYVETLNDNIISLGTNISLYFKAQTEALSDWLKNIRDSVNGVWNAFLLWWEDWGKRMDSIQDKLDQITNGSDDNVQKSEDLENQVSTESTEFQDNMDVIQDWTRPDYENDFDGTVDGITGGADTQLYTQAFRGFFNNRAYITPLLFMAFSFSVISFVVFGKR